ncbi:MAG: hypothetical protein AB7O37_00560 [Vicinamibacteria bacterium]
MPEFLIDTAWAGPLLWALAYLSDNLLTIACAVRYRAQDKLVFEGSYELTPLWVADVNALRRLSPRFGLALVGSTLYVILVQRALAPSPDLRHVYLGILGALLGLQMTIHVRHLRNWYLFTRGIQHLRGRIEYPRAFMFRASAHEMGLFGAVYAIAFAVSQSPFLLGAALACGVLALNHRFLARRHEKALAGAA